MSLTNPIADLLQPRSNSGAGTFLKIAGAYVAAVFITNPDPVGFFASVIKPEASTPVLALPPVERELFCAASITGLSKANSHNKTVQATCNGSYSWQAMHVWQSVRTMHKPHLATGRVTLG